MDSPNGHLDRVRGPGDTTVCASVPQVGRLCDPGPSLLVLFGSQEGLLLVGLNSLLLKCPRYLRSVVGFWT